MNDFSSAAHEWIRAHAHEMIDELRCFVSIRSVSRADQAGPGAPFGPQCREMLDHALKRASEMDFDAQDHDGYCGSAILGDGGNAIGFIGHLDVVPEGENWLHKPYSPMQEGDFLFGRGVSDNKCAVVAGLYLMRMFRELNVPLRHGIRLIMGCAEETGMQDLPHFLENNPAPVLSLIPDGEFPVNYAQKSAMSGNMSIPLGDQIASFSGGEVFNMVPPSAEAAIVGVDGEKLRRALADSAAISVTPRPDGALVRAKGRAAHAANPSAGVSAIHLLSEALANSALLSGQSLRAMEAIREMTRDIYGANAGIDGEDPDTGKTTMNVGVARTRGGAAHLTLDCRVSITADREKNTRAFQAYAASLGFQVSDMAVTQPVYMPRDDQRVLALMKVYREMTNDPSPAYTMGGGTYARVMPDALTFGPGFPGGGHRPQGLPEGHGGAHAPDEYLYIPDYLKAVEIYARAIAALDQLI